MWLLSHVLRKNFPWQCQKIWSWMLWPLPLSTHLLLELSDSAWASGILWRGGEGKTEAQKSGWHLCQDYSPTKKKFSFKAGIQEASALLLPSNPCTGFQRTHLHCEGPTPRASWLLRLIIEGQAQLWQVHLEDQWVYRKKK